MADKLKHLRLGVNIDHVATIRNARGGLHPDPVRAALIAIEAGADGITAHLREDRRHIRDEDISHLKSKITKPLNLEMAVTDEMLQIALRHKPHACCLVPEKRQELTTEGGLDVISAVNKLKPFITKLKDAGIRVSLFIDPVHEHVAKSRELGADIVELHTGTYCHVSVVENPEQHQDELNRIVNAAHYASEIGLEVHAGHGLSYDNVGPVAAIPQMVELNIGHFLIGEAIFTGLNASIQRMRQLMDQARNPSLL